MRQNRTKFLFGLRRYGIIAYGLRPYAIIVFGVLRSVTEREERPERSFVLLHRKNKRAQVHALSLSPYLIPQTYRCRGLLLNIGVYASLRT